MIAAISTLVDNMTKPQSDTDKVFDPGIRRKANENGRKYERDGRKAKKRGMRISAEDDAGADGCSQLHRSNTPHDEAFHFFPPSAVSANLSW